MNQSGQKPLADKKIICFSRFENNPSSHGGDKRAAQICEFLQQFDYEFVSTCNPPFIVPQKMHALLYNPSGYFQKKRSLRYKQRITYAKYFKWSERFRDALLNWHFLSQLFIENLDKSPELLIIDDPVFLAPVVLYAKSRGIPIVALIHNIETLSREQVEYSHQREMFTYELELLSHCALVVTISQEETWLLRNFGMDPVYLPYFPIKQSADRCDNVRTKRQHSIKANFLLFGTVYNLPTLEGMKKVITAITRDSILHNDRLIIAGYGTIQLANFADDPRIEVRGDLTDAELDELLTETKGCIVYQVNGSGALTKIPEILTAGVPVIINSHAARSHHNLPGIFEFDTFEQLGEQLEAAAQAKQFPKVLSPPDSTILKKRILDLIK